MGRGSRFLSFAQTLKENESMEKITVVLCFILCALSFHLGKHWEAYVIKNELQEHGVVTRNWGDHKAVIITGTAEDIDK